MNIYSIFNYYCSYQWYYYYIYIYLEIFIRQINFVVFNYDLIVVEIINILIQVLLNEYLINKFIK